MWRRKRRPSPETEQARERLAVAEADLEAARADDDPVDEVARKLRELRHRNHFGPMITSALRGSK
ncbi:DUF7620 family protein [Micromonospora rifamycinica]|uniref:DUF7620 family protein n=1 Tax=Micromonospora rifamycinica TaxID=291594 RepID=UPI003F5790F0